MNRKMIGKIAIMATVAMLSLTGCGAQEQLSEETIVSIEDLLETGKVQKALADAEKSASVLEKKLMEDASLTQTDMNTLSMEIYQVWDDTLNELWKALKSALDEESMGDLLEEQRAWITKKEEEVKKAGEEFGGGSMAALVANQKAAELTKTRVYELASLLGAEGTLD